MPFDFAFPLGVYGNSSAWSPPRGIDLYRFSDISARRLVGLKVCTTATLASTERLDPVHLDEEYITKSSRPFPFLQKVPYVRGEGLHEYVGISSGAGSAIFRSETGRTYKLKRCGLGDVGFGGSKARGNATFQRGEDHFDETHAALVGLMSLQSASAECRMTAKFRQAGLSMAYTPIGVVVPRHAAGGGVPWDPLQSQIAAVVMEVTSDLRVDELTYMALTPLLAELFDAGHLSYDVHYPLWALFDSHGIPLARTRRKWRHLSERVRAIGFSAGSLYRRCHEAGFLRGLASSWPGNEVVHPDGQISLVDFDGGTSSASEFPPDVSDVMKQAEFHQYSADSYLFFTTSRPTTLKLFGIDFLEGVKDGYHADYRPIDSDLLGEIVSEHFTHCDSLWTAMGFAADASTPTDVPLDLPSGPLV